MRISDWSSDVCSSDLQKSTPLPRSHGSSLRLSAHSMTICSLHIARCRPEKPGNVRLNLPLCRPVQIFHLFTQKHPDTRTPRRLEAIRMSRRSEEHTSELQSLMRASDAVFCLKKKTKQYHTTNQNSHN